jgi:protein-disulfide isomerase
MLNRSLLIAAAVVALAACDKKDDAVPEVDVNAPLNATPVAAPANGDWTTIVSETPEGGFMMGNPQAKAKLVEFGSMTCPHCREFEEEAHQALLDKYVKTGLLAFEFRNYVRDPFDMTASMIARCGGKDNFFPLTHALYEDQMTWAGKIQTADAEKLNQIQAMPPQAQFAEFAKLTGLDSFAAMRGMPRAQIDKCLADESMATKLVEMNSDAQNRYEVSGTPTFLLNGEVVDMKNGETVWKQLEPKIRGAISG